jgi:hypothetical protein
MMVQCQKSCYVCGDQEYDGDGSDFGVPQRLGDRDFMTTEQSVRHRLSMAYRYLQNVDVPANIKTQCVNEHADCTNWAVAGECDANPVWMKKECAASCQSCDFLLYLERCPMDVDNPGDIWQENDLNDMFEKRKLTNKTGRTLSVAVVSSTHRGSNIIIFGGLPSHQRSIFEQIFCPNSLVAICGWSLGVAIRQCIVQTGG